MHHFLIMNPKTDMNMNINPSLHHFFHHLHSQHCTHGSPLYLINLESLTDAIVLIHHSSNLLFNTSSTVRGEYPSKDAIACYLETSSELLDACVSLSHSITLAKTWQRILGAIVHSLSLSSSTISKAQLERSRKLLRCALSSNMGGLHRISSHHHQKKWVRELKRWLHAFFKSPRWRWSIRKNGHNSGKSTNHVMAFNTARDPCKEEVQDPSNVASLSSLYHISALFLRNFTTSNKECGQLNSVSLINVVEMEEAWRQVKSLFHYMMEDEDGREEEVRRCVKQLKQQVEDMATHLVSLYHQIQDLFQTLVVRQTNFLL